MLYPFVKTKKCEEENISVLGKYWYQNDPSFDTGIYFFIFQKAYRLKRNSEVLLCGSIPLWLALIGFLCHSRAFRIGG